MFIFYKDFSIRLFLIKNFLMQMLFALTVYLSLTVKYDINIQRAYIDVEHIEVSKQLDWLKFILIGI